MGSSAALKSAIFVVACASASPSVHAVPLADPLRFFEGRTESIGVMKLIMKRPYKVRSIGRGKINPDGSLLLVQQVHDDGQPPKERTWRIKQVGPGKYAGSMSEAVGPVKIEQVGDGYRFRFKIKGNLTVEQWLVPDPDGNSGSSKLTIRKYGVKVASADATIRKLSR
jgi:hypothetical protein